MRMKTYCLILAALLALAGGAWAQWPTSPEERLFLGYGVESRIVSDGEGGAFVIFTSYPGSTWNTCYMQKLDPQGYPQLFPLIQLDVGFGQLTTAIEAVTDGQGGVIAAVTQTNTTTGMMKLGLFRLSRDCDTLYWNCDPDTMNFTLIHPHCAADSVGGIYLLYGHHNDPYFADAHLCVQHIGPGGEQLWGTAGFIIEGPLQPGVSDQIALCADWNYCYATIRTDTVRALKYDRDGIAVWGIQGVIIPYSGQEPQMAPDGTGGFVEIHRRNLNPGVLRATRVDSAGNWAWPGNGIDLGIMHWNKSVICRNPLIYVAWDSGGNLPAPEFAKLHIMDYQGNSVLPQNITVFSSTIEQGEVQMRDAIGTGLIFCGRQRFGAQYDFYTQKYDYSGQRLWDQDVLVRSVDLLYQNMYQNDFGGALFSWCEIDPLYGQLICAAMINSDGELGVLGVTPAPSFKIFSFENAHVFPNPANSQSKLYLPDSFLPNGYVKISLNNLLGQELLEADIFAKTNVVPLQFGRIGQASLCSGLYYLRVTAGEMTWISRFLYLK